MRIGLLGGTFNPPHLGHLRLAEEVAYSHDLAKVIFVPSFIPPHKNRAQTAPPQDRLAMTHLACKGNPVFEVSDAEIALQGPSYTVSTLEVFAGKSDLDVFFILGTDSLREIHTWRDYERLFHLSHFIAVTRPGTDFQAAWNEVPDGLRESFSWQNDHLVHSSATMLIPSPVTGLDISATRIRALLKSGRSIRYLVPEAVRAYILARNLYGS